MLLNRFYCALVSMFTGSLTGVSEGTFSTRRPIAEKTLGWVRPSARSTYIACAECFNFQKYMSLAYDNTPSADSDTASGVYFGDGDSPVTGEDFFLAGNVVSGYAYTSKVSVTNVANGNGYDELTGVTITSVFTITNNNAEDITIKEACLCTPMGALSKTSYGLSSVYNVAVDRTVLDSPVTIPAGGVGQVTYEITVKYPTA